jgi:hypothetical protein
VLFTGNPQCIFIIRIEEITKDKSNAFLLGRIIELAQRFTQSSAFPFRLFAQ